MKIPNGGQLWRLCIHGEKDEHWPVKSVVASEVVYCSGGQLVTDLDIYRQGIIDGKTEGYHKGFDDGYQNGYATSIHESLSSEREETVSDEPSTKGLPA